MNQSCSKALLSQFFNLKKFQTNTDICVAVAVVVVVVRIFLMQISSHKCQPEYFHRQSKRNFCFYQKKRKKDCFTIHFKSFDHLLLVFGHI